MKWRPNKLLEGYHFNYKHDGFYNRNASFESSDTEVLCYEKQSFTEIVYFNFCFLAKNAVEQKKKVFCVLIFLQSVLTCSEEE